MLELSRKVRLWLAVIGLLLLAGTRLPALTALPLHNDEGLHLTRAVQVWNLKPFWEIGDGKIVNHWLIAAFYPQNAPDFAGRVATVFVALIGLAAGIAIGSRYGTYAGWLVIALWVGSPYLFFYERTALSDAEAGAFVCLTLWAALRLARSNALRDAVLTGFALALAALFKLTAAPFAALPVLIVMLAGRGAWWGRIGRLAIVGAVVVACFAVPVGYLVWRGGNFGIAGAWLAGGSGSLPLVANFVQNIGRLWEAFTGFGGGLGWASAIVIGAGVGFAISTRPALAAAVMVPFAALLVIGVEPMPRHWVVSLPAFIVLSAVSLGGLVQRIGGRRGVHVVGSTVGIVLACFVPFAAAAYTAPATLTLPPLDREQFISGHPSGYGLREAMIALPSLVPPNTDVVADMFPDSCRRANFYALPGYSLRCIDLAVLHAGQGGAAYVLAEKPPIGLTYDAQGAQVISEFPRPQGNSPVTLWRVR